MYKCAASIPRASRPCPERGTSPGARFGIICVGSRQILLQALELRRLAASRRQIPQRHVALTRQRLQVTAICSADRRNLRECHTFTAQSAPARVKESGDETALHCLALPVALTPPHNYLHTPLPPRQGID